MIDRICRLRDLLASRSQSYKELFASQSVAQTLAWAGKNQLLGFNRSAIRLRILYSLVQAFQATHFIETGTYHGATAVCAHQGLGMKVWTCEISHWNNWLARAICYGLRNVKAIRADSRMFLLDAVPQLKKIRGVRPVFYLDAHAGINQHSCPILEEISLVGQLDCFLAIIDDFEVPGRAFAFSTYGTMRLSVDLVRKPLLSSGIRQVFFPSYPPELEAGFARTGYVAFFRSAALENGLQDASSFPLNLLQSCELSDGRLSQSCVSS